MKLREIKRILCPSHEENTPSCSVYLDGTGYCHACGASFRNMEVPLDVSPKPPEDLEAKIRYIKTLDLVDYRGLQFPADKYGYYVVWPMGVYYKLRRWESQEGRGKYIGAAGHKKPWFNLLNGPKDLGICAIVEGEINAMSLEKAYPNLDIYSPGGVGNFSDSTAKSILPIITQYATIHIIVDADGPGIDAAIKFKKEVQPPCLDVHIHLMGEDVNHILVNKGVKAIREQIEITGTVYDV